MTTATETPTEAPIEDIAAELTTRGYSVNVSALSAEQIDSLRAWYDSQDTGDVPEFLVDANPNGQPEANGEDLELLKTRLDKLNRHDQAVRAAEEEVAEAEEVWKEAKESAKEAKAAFDGAVRHLRNTIRARENGQQTLPFAEPHPDVEAGKDRPHGTPALDAVAKMHREGEDVHGLASIEALGMSEKETELLVAAEIKTVIDLEKRMREDEWWHRNIKGFGPAKVDKLSDALLAYRKEHPVPGDDHSDATVVADDADGNAERRSAYELGCHAAVDNVPREENPFGEDDERRQHWFDGYDETNGADEDDVPEGLE